LENWVFLFLRGLDPPNLGELNPALLIVVEANQGQVSEPIYSPAEILQRLTPAETIPYQGYRPEQLRLLIRAARNAQRRAHVPSTQIRILLR
jgi:hypothetical protein